MYSIHLNEAFNKLITNYDIVDKFKKEEVVMKYEKIQLQTNLIETESRSTNLASH